MTGLDLLRAEMARQFDDARATLAAPLPAASVAAALIRRKGRLLLLGMGGSHWINRVAEPHYRAAGIDCTAQVLSEAMRAPQPGDPAVILTSQSGASGEVLRWLEGRDAAEVIGLTLDPASRLAAVGLPLVGAGGVEHAYAATRSLLVTLALHAAILAELGADIAAFRAALHLPPGPAAGRIVGRIAAARNAVFVGRGALQGVADGVALSLMELARLPVLSLEAGQFRHGPFEMVGPETAMVFLRGQGAEGDNIAALAAELVGHGLQPIVFDLTGDSPVPGTLTHPLPQARGLAAAVAALTGMQAAVVAAAAQMVPDAGTPLRSTKVTSGEAA